MAFRQGEDEMILTVEVEAETGDLLIGGKWGSGHRLVFTVSEWGCVKTWTLHNIELILPARWRTGHHIFVRIRREKSFLSRGLGGTACDYPGWTGWLLCSWNG